MTYPPQHPGQPYPGQPGGPQGHPQQYPPQQYPGQQQYPAGQQQYPGAVQGYPQGIYGQGGYPQAGYGRPGQPPKSKKGLWVGLSVGLVALIGAFSVTAWVAPGFLVHKKPRITVQPANPEEAKAVAQKFADGIKAHDVPAAVSTICPSSQAQIGVLVDDFSRNSVDLTVTGAEGADTVIVTLVGTHSGDKPAQVSLLVNHPRDGGPNYCVGSISSSMVFSH